MKKTSKTKNPIKNIINLGRSTIESYKSKDAIRDLGNEMGFCLVALHNKNLSLLLKNKDKKKLNTIIKEIHSEIGDLDIYSFKKEIVIDMLDSVSAVSKSIEKSIRSNKRNAAFILKTGGDDIMSFLSNLEESSTDIKFSKGDVLKRLEKACLQ